MRTKEEVSEQKFQSVKERGQWVKPADHHANRCREDGQNGQIHASIRGPAPAVPL